MNFTKKVTLIRSNFHRIGPLGRFDHRVAMSVCLSFCLFVCPFSCDFFRGLSLALRSYDQFKDSHWSTRGPSSWTVPAWSLKNKELFRIGLLDFPRLGGVHPTRSPDSWTWLVELYKQWVVPDWTRGSFPHGALKTRKSSGLESSIVPAFCPG